MPIHLDLYWNDPEACFISPAADAALTYVLSESEVTYNSLSSSSIESYFASNTVNVHAREYKHCYNNVASGSSQVLLRIPSNTTNTAAVISFLQSQSNLNNISKEKLENCFFNVSNYNSVDMRVNTRSIYAEKLQDYAVSDLYHQLAHTFPEIQSSRAITATEFAFGASFVLCQNLSGAPRQFQRSLISGITSSRLNIDMALKLEFKAPLTDTLQVDSFVLSQILYRFVNGTIELIQ